jgi:hypothetical protein
MKNVSTAATKQMRKFSQLKWTVDVPAGSSSDIRQFPMPRFTKLPRARTDPCVPRLNSLESAVEYVVRGK